MSTTGGHKGYPYETLSPEKAEQEQIILPSSPESAEPITLAAWKSRRGNYYLTEASARNDGATHQQCKGENCNTPVRKGWRFCDQCEGEARRKRYLKLPFQEWDGDTPLALFDNDDYFTSDSDIEWYCDENEILPADLELVLCEPAYLNEISFDIWDDQLPEDAELPKEVVDAVEHLNKLLRSNPVGFLPGKTRTTVII